MRQRSWRQEDRRGGNRSGATTPRGCPWWRSEAGDGTGRDVTLRQPRAGMCFFPALLFLAALARPAAAPVQLGTTFLDFVICPEFAVPLDLVENAISYGARGEACLNLPDLPLEVFLEAGAAFMPFNLGARWTRIAWAPESGTSSTRCPASPWSCAVPGGGRTPSWEQMRSGRNPCCSQPRPGKAEGERAGDGL
jgi:hypothetical protein